MCYNEKGDQLPCFPSEITIIQGSKVGSAPLPYNIGIAIWDDYKSKAVFKAATGLEKNKPVPAVGVINGLSTSKKLRPGMAEDVLTVPIYQCEDAPEVGRTAALYEYVADVIVTGEEIDSLIPENSPVDITLKVDTSEQMTMDIYFPSVDFTVSKSLDTSKKQNVAEAERQIPQLYSIVRLVTNSKSLVFEELGICQEGFLLRCGQNAQPFPSFIPAVFDAGIEQI